MTEHRTLKLVGGILLGLSLAIVLFAALFDWNWLREPIARRISSSTGRSFAINGNLDVQLSMHPRIVANDIALGNAEWAREPRMAEIKRLDFRIDGMLLMDPSPEHISFDTTLDAVSQAYIIRSDGVD